MDPAGIQVLMRQVEKEQLAMALKGANDEIRQLFFGNLSHLIQKQIMIKRLLLKAVILFRKQHGVQVLKMLFLLMVKYLIQKIYMILNVVNQLRDHLNIWV